MKQHSAFSIRHSAAHPGRRGGFTLIELLVVIAIIVLILSLLVPAALALRRSAKCRRAGLEARTLAQAITAYRTEYGKWPNQTADTDDATYTNSAPIVAALTTDSVLNPRRLVFIEIPASSLVSGAYMDPWGQSYVIAMDENADGTVHLVLPTAFGSNLVVDIPNQTVVVASGGPDPTDPSKRICSWTP